MPYVQRVVLAGQTREVKKMYTGRIHTKGAPRAENHSQTTEAQHKANERLAEEKLRWLLNANFTYKDLHVVLHYYDKPRDLEQAEEDKRKFLRYLRQHCKRKSIPWKFVACTESRHTPHHHIILPAISMDSLLETWEKVVGVNGGNVSVKPLDRRGNHAKLAHYLIKETSQTVKQYREMGKRYKRFTSARNMIRPEPKYTIVQANAWTKEPRRRKGWAFWQDDNGTSIRQGIHDLTGYPWQEYTEIWLGAGPPPGAGRRIKS